MPVDILIINAYLIVLSLDPLDEYIKLKLLLHKQDHTNATRTQKAQ